ncbi:MAG TPA: EAL domain-containing protein [Steroidobacteraceae bacterium]|nr:EAL domain-containing protein [Steroidobacteraceae bacterium]
MLQKLRAARAAANPAGAPVPTLAPARNGATTVESLGQQLREVLPARRLQSVSLCDHEANVLWLSEGALGPDEHGLVTEALEVLTADPSIPCHETAVEDGRLAVFLPVRAPTGSLVGVAMILADSKSVGDDTLERLTATPIRTIMQRLAVLLKPSGAAGAAAPAVHAPVPLEPDEVVTALEAAEVAEPPEAVELSGDPEPVAAIAAELELALVPEEPLASPPAPAAAPAAADDLSDTDMTAAEIAGILELELTAEEVQPAPAARPAPAAGPSRPAAKPVKATPAASEGALADSGMLKLEFLAEPPVVQPAANPRAVAKKLQAASKAAEVAPTRGPRPLPAAAARANPPDAKAKAPAPGVPDVKTPAATAPVTRSVTLVPGAASARARNPFEPVTPHSRLTANPGDDVVVLFDSDPAEVRPRATPAKAAPAPEAPSAPPAKPAAPPARLPPAARTAPAARTPAPARPAPAAPRPQPAARTPPPSPIPVAPVPAAPAPLEPAAAVAPPVAAPPPRTAAAAAAAPAASMPSPPLDLVPFAKLRAGGQTRRFQVQARAPTAARDPAALDEQTVQQLLAWLAANRAHWNGVPTTFTVNLSIATLEDERFLTRVGAALNTHGIAAETLGFEIAESLCGQQRAKVERFLAQCEKLGVWIAIDDFSFDSQVLPLLRSKALRMLKLDARLTSAALRDKLSQAVVVATVQAAKVLGIHCSAKKTDSHASLQYLAAIGLDYAQGAALSKTVPLEAIAAVVDSRSGGMPDPENNE